jgi:uncharacterized protein YdhG (YjbR/CyaY superfamily)
MVRSDAVTVEQYLTELDPERRQEVSAVRDVVLANLPEGYQESMNWGMISYEIPLERYPDTYNRQPLVYAALASQKNYMSLYLMGLYGDPEEEQSFEERYRATGKRYDVGKSCVRFRRLEDLPLDLIAEVIASTPVDEYIARYEAAR